MVFRDLIKTNRNILFNLVKFLQLEMHSSYKFKLGQETSLGGLAPSLLDLGLLVISY